MICENGTVVKFLSSGPRSQRAAWPKRKQRLRTVRISSVDPSCRLGIWRDQVV